MAPSKKAQTSPKTRSSTSSSSISLKKVKGENFYRNAKQASRLKMLNGGKPIRDKDGKIIQAAAFQKGEDETRPGRVQPDRRWFGNTRVISQTALDHFRTNLFAKKDDPYSVLLRRNKLPMALLDDAANPHTQKRPHIVETEPFSETFGPKAQRKKPKLDAGDFEELSKFGTAPVVEEAKSTVPVSPHVTETIPTELQTHADYSEPIYAKGTSRRIYGELYKVIDSSDVILHILDARDPMGTLCESVLEYIKREKAHKQVVLVINKCDLVPNWVTARYIQHLTPRFPTIAFHASPNHSFGKGSLIQLLRQFSQLHSDKKQISVGFIGYPNVGKSSVINTLKSGKVCRVAPVPGETKVWQYITLTRRIYLIDCPGIVPTSAHDSQTSTVLKGVVRVEALQTPSEHIPALLERVKPIYISRTYGISLPDPNNPTQGWEAEELLDRLARMKGRLLKQGEPDMDAVAKIILSDWEEKERMRKAKTKARELGLEGGREGDRPHVKQNLGSIMQKNTFMADDIRSLDEIIQEGSEDDGSYNKSPGLGSKAGDASEDDDEDLRWTDVFEGVQQTPDLQTSSEDDKIDQEGMFWYSADEEEEEEESGNHAAQSKEPRMSTNKVRLLALLTFSLRIDWGPGDTQRKATNFYSTANVKNKNRSNASRMKRLPAGKRQRP
ncbi:hypothetical protein D9757_008291 [Collybiopsis confluens]|uniref:Nucleolar GTP-binding protein 2 n=1 Tax=Collybiopsis confluens TaxID=2823264 RepID=A0A8H5H4I8_9AGAR|nr:hypothetical protein D9757_008291 [Collybiopsis confluens]